MRAVSCVCDHVIGYSTSVHSFQVAPSSISIALRDIEIHQNQAPTNTRLSAMVRRRAICAYINPLGILLRTGAPRPLSRREESQAAGNLS